VLVLERIVVGRLHGVAGRMHEPELAAGGGLSAFFRNALGDHPEHDLVE
jgi:hypothetical protein